MRIQQITKFLIILVIFFVYICEHAVAQSLINISNHNEQKKNIHILPGDYLRSDYMETLEKTHSPIQSDVFNMPQFIRTQMKKDGLFLLSIFNFHEGGPEFILFGDGSIITQISAGFNTSNLFIDVIDDQHFELGFDKFKPMTYIFVGEVDLYVANKILVGRYIDESGQNYIFGIDEWAVFPNNKFQYRIGLDHILLKYDYFEDVTSNKVYAFKIKNEVLEIFGTSGENNENIDKQPLFSLKKIGK